MKMRFKIIFILFLFVPFNIFAITGSGTVSSGEKEAIYLYNDPYCDKDNDESRYGPIGGVFLRDATDETISYSLDDYMESTNVYADENLAKKACDKFIKSQGNGELLCKDTPTRSAYACKGTIGKLNESTNTVDTSQYDYLYKYINGGQLFETEAGCLYNCEGKCSLETGNTFRYVATETVEEEGKIASITGRIFQTSKGDLAFCLQPAKEFYCPYYYVDSKELIPQYCLNNTFDLSVCIDDYNSDYRCGISYIAFTALGASKDFSKDQYGAADLAMRMWAANRGHLSGTKSTEFSLQGGDKTKVNFYGITAQRVEEDANYLEYGIPCTKTAKNHGVVCNNEYETYMKSLKLYSEASQVGTFDAGGNRVPILVTTTLINSGNTLQLTNPTKVPCEKGSENCRTVITLYNSNGQEIDSNDNYCDKNYCYAEYSNESLCESSVTESALVKVTIKDYSVKGDYNEYHNCTDPTDRQIMFTITNGSASTETKTDYVNTYKPVVTCGCNGDILKTTSNAIDCTDEKCEDGVRICNDKNKSNTKASDYDGVETGIIKDPPMADILNKSKACEKERNYFRATEYETYEDTCKIYCRKEVEFKLANKEKVYSGMQFRYELEEKITNNLDSGEHLTSIVYQRMQCVSEIYYDTPNPDIEDKSMDTWLERFDAAEAKVADAWNNWKKWDTLKWYQEFKNDYPAEISVAPTCSADCNGYKSAGIDETLENCKKYNESQQDALAASGADGHIAKKPCEDYNGGLSDFTGVTGLCAPQCTSMFEWTPRSYNTITWPNGEVGRSSSSYTSGSTSGAQSTMVCDAMAGYSTSGRDSYPCGNKFKNTCYERGSASGVCTKKINSHSEYNEINFEALARSCAPTYEETFSFSTTTKTYESSGSCSSGTQGNEGDVKKEALKYRDEYYAAQEAVQELLTAIQSCSMYGGLPSENDIQTYTLTKAPPGPDRDGSGEGTPGGGGGGLAGGGGAAKTAAEVKEYKAKTLETNAETDDFEFFETASTDNEVSIKRKIMSTASCKDDKCVNLDLSYDPLNKNSYGKTSTYSKVTGIIETDKLFNAYCDDGEDCYRRVHTTDKVDVEDTWPEHVVDSQADIGLIVCDITKPDPANQTCKKTTEQVPDNDYVSFKVTTEVDFYRNKNYYAKAFTGEVVESKSAAKFSSKIYSSLGKNVYPVEKDLDSGNYDVDYIFSNLGVSRFGEKENSNNLSTFKYSCSYEVYNNSTAYDCAVQYNDDGTPKNDDCSNFCFYVEDSVPDLRCINWYRQVDDKGYGFVYRNVDLENLFPNGRKYGNNWSNAAETISEIQNTGDDLYATTDHLELSVTLNSDSIKKIREYNRFKNTNAGGYLDNSLSYCDLNVSLDGTNNRFFNCRSSFVDEMEKGSGVLGIDVNYIDRKGRGTE